MPCKLALAKLMICICAHTPACHLGLMLCCPPYQRKRDTQEKFVQSHRAKLNAEVQAFKVQHSAKARLRGTPHASVLMQRVACMLQHYNH